MSLLQDVLRTQTLESLDKTLAASPTIADTDSDDELINVVSTPGTPAFSRPSSRPSSRPPSRPSSRAASPSRNQRRNGRTAGSLTLTSTKSSSDPLRVLTTDISQRIFSLLSITDLAKCARVSRKWSRSQTLNYVWFQHYRKDYFHDNTLPTGKWSKRESKQNWRATYLQTLRNREQEPVQYSRPITPASNHGSGSQTPREMREEKWKLEAEAQQKPTKIEMREMYKELGGRKARAKGKVGTPGGARDKGGWGEDAGGMLDYMYP
ncbi:hypothetical protein NM688_g8927 [Phlebia brevispora]|uniref:Uncharacterized protein n=1 Tax=Phlebia brevispora TaxID=194682 RepID=A0ACC1RNY4_9APHY|nr:hypothetical protein NM688_g8927 [Phlebia brevispora]